MPSHSTIARADADSNPLPLIAIVCPLCGADRSTPVTRARDYVYAVPGLYEFVRCCGCSHIFINPRPADEVLMECYPKNYAPHIPRDDSSQAADAEQSVGKRRSFARRLLGRVPLLKPLLIWLGRQHATVVPAPRREHGARLLKVGCAHGGYLAEAAAAGWDVDGIEPDEAAARRARSRGFDVQVSTLTAAGLPEASRDAVAAWMVLEHVPDPVAMVREVHRILTPEGVFCVSVPNGGGFERRLFGRYWLGYDAPRHLQVFTAGRLRELLQEIGFIEVRVIHQSSIRYWWGSIAAWGMDHRMRSAWPARWMGYFINEPPSWMRWLSLLPEKTLALLHCSGRITVIARKPPMPRQP